MGRFAPTVLPSSTARRPGLEIAQAFSDFRVARGEEEDREFLREDRDIAAAERERLKPQQARDAARDEFSFDEEVRNRFGGTPVREGATPPADRTPVELMDPTGAQPPEDVAGAFQEWRQGLPAQPPTQPPPGPQDPIRGPSDPPLNPEVAVLPGQFAGGVFAPQAVTVQPPQRQEYGGRMFDIDPTQTQEARGIAAQEAALQQEVDALVASGVDPERARAVAMFDLEEEFVTPEEAPVKGFDPDRTGTFSSRQEYIAFQEELAAAKRGVDTPTQGEGPIDLDDAFAEVDNIFGEWEGELMTGHRLSEGERLRVARGLADGSITPDELDQLAAPEPEPEDAEPFRFEAGPVKRLFQSILPWGKTGLETVGTPTPATAEETSAPRAETPVTPSTAPPVLDSISSVIGQIREQHPNLTDEQIRGLLVEEYGEDDVDVVLRGG